MTILTNVATIITNQKYIFVHSSKNDSFFCLNCFKERTKELKSYQQYFGWQEDEPSHLEAEIIATLLQKLQTSNEPYLYEINRDTLEIQAKATFKRGDCHCNEDTAPHKLQELDTMFDAKDNRQLSFEQVREKIERNKKTNLCASIVDRECIGSFWRFLWYTNGSDRSIVQGDFNAFLWSDRDV
ncbi:hypothetical protein OL548_29325 [Lysinibacillus sp. MHQ-1]|nr:hypothetical protein OL548_29325 [Lysinibacillus sp. MHQ-1]